MVNNEVLECFPAVNECSNRKLRFVFADSSYAPISRRAWEFLISIYEGGPEVPHPLYVAPSQTSKRPIPSSSDDTPVKAVLKDSTETALPNKDKQIKSKAVAKSRSIETSEDVEMRSCEESNTEMCK